MTSFVQHLWVVVQKQFETGGSLKREISKSWVKQLVCCFTMVAA
jgi:hypothetical protein